MTNVKKVAGIDISKEFFDVCVIANEQVQEKKFSNDLAGIKAAAKWLPKDIECVMEVTGAYYMRLAVHLHQQGFTVCVINPLVIKRFSQMRLIRAKTDKADAKMIATYAIAEQPQRWDPPQQYVVTLQQLDAISEQLVKQQTALGNQLEAFTATGMMEKETKQFLMRSIKTLKRQITEVENKINAVIINYHGELMKMLLSIPGMGKKTAAKLIVISNGFEKFSSPKQLAAYIGISPRIYESGSSIKGKARVCKMGMGRARALLYLCSWSAKRWNKACKDLYERLVAKGKAKQQALIAVANKLIKQAFAIAVNKRYYVDGYLKNI
jgi:transposase